MINLPPLRPINIQALMRILADNPLLVALFLISPPDALRYMGFDVLAVLFDDLRPTNPADIARVQELVRALNHEQTTLEEAQVVQPAAPVEDPLPQPAERVYSAGQRPDVQFGVSKAMLQHVLALYTQHSFKGKTFTMPIQRWGDVRLVGENLSLDLTPGVELPSTGEAAQARIVATFQGTARLRMPLPLGRSAELGALNSPVVLNVLTTVFFDQDNRLTLDIRHGEIRLTGVPLPEMVARELVRQLIVAVPTIPLVKMPTHFELPDGRGGIADVVALKARDVRIEADGVWLEFHLDQGSDE
jgi:hypothetical protein